MSPPPPPSRSRLIVSLAAGDASLGAEGPDFTEIVMVEEEQLLLAVGVDKMESSWYTYTLQMALKLLASSLVVKKRQPAVGSALKLPQ